MIFVISITSCVKEESLSSNFNDVKVEFRSGPSDWCDGGATSPPAAAIINSYPDPLNPGWCCVTLRTVANSNIRLGTSNYDFNSSIGSPTGSFYYGTSNSSGLVTICFEQIGTHFIVEVNAPPFYGCIVFENQC